MKPLSILIVKTSALGDVVQTLPVLSDLRRRFPDAKIDWVVEKGSAGLLAALPHLNDVIQIDTKLWRKNLFKKKTWKEIAALRKRLKSSSYDLLFDLQGNTKSAVVTSWAKAKVKVGFGRKSVPEWPNLLATHSQHDVTPGINARLRYLEIVQSHFGAEAPLPAPKVDFSLTEAEKASLDAWVMQFPKAPKLMVLFGSKWPNKRLSPETLQRLLTMIDRSIHPFFLFIWGDEEEKSLAEELGRLFSERSLALGGMTLPLWQALMQEVDGVLAVDSLGLHLCGTTNTPSFSIFGPSSLQVYKPLGQQHAAFQGACPYGQTFEKRCPKLRSCPTGACMKEVSEEKLFDNFMSWWLRRADQN